MITNDFITAVALDEAMPADKRFTLKAETTADLIAEAVRATFDSMSTTDKNAVQAAVLRAQRKALKTQMSQLKTKKAE